AAGFVRAVPSIEPPRRLILLTAGIVSGWQCPGSPCARYLNPSWNPITSMPPLIASMVTALITPLMPGAGPPPTTSANLSRLGLEVTEPPPIELTLLASSIRQPDRRGAPRRYQKRAGR